MNFPIFKSRYFWFVVCITFLYKLVALTIYVKYYNHLSYVWSEGNVGENIAAAAWGLGFLLCMIKWVFFFGKEDKWVLWFWCSSAFFLGFTRELDMHKKLEDLFGITWKMEWMGDADVSIFFKIVLVLIFATIILGMFGTIAWKHRSILRELKNGNMQITIFIMGMVYMAVGFLFDGTVLGEPVLFDIITRSFTKLCEESFETIAAVCACLAVIPFFYRKNSFS